MSAAVCDVDFIRNRSWGNQEVRSVICHLAVIHLCHRKSTEQTHCLYRPSDDTANAGFFSRMQDIVHADVPLFASPITAALDS